jgi:hypothetical protein
VAGVGDGHRTSLAVCWDFGLGELVGVGWGGVKGGAGAASLARRPPSALVALSGSFWLTSRSWRQTRSWALEGRWGRWSVGRGRLVDPPLGLEPRLPPVGGQETLRPDVGLDPDGLGDGKPHPRFSDQANRFIGKLKDAFSSGFSVAGRGAVKGRAEREREPERSGGSERPLRAPEVAAINTGLRSEAGGALFPLLVWICPAASVLLTLVLILVLVCHLVRLGSRSTHQMHLPVSLTSSLRAGRQPSSLNLSLRSLTVFTAAHSIA